MSENKRLSERNTKIAAMLSDGELLKNFYRFIAQNPYINLHDACQIVIERPDATVCNSMEEWNALGRRVTKGRKAISYYDHDGYKQFVFDAADTHGEERYQRPIFPLKRMLIGLDELNGTSLYDDLRGDYRKIHNGVYTYLEKSGALTGDEQHDNLLSEGVAFSLYCKTGFPKTAGIHLSGLPYSYRENAEFVKEMYIQSELLAEEIDEAYEGKLQEVKVIDDTEEETVTDEPIIRGGEVEQTKEPLTEETEELPEQGNEVSVSPVYRQYLDVQKANPQAVVLLRLGDFYEVMGENARTVAEELDLTLTSREVGLPERVPMCGFPYHVAEVYIEKILEHHGVLLAEAGQEPKYILSHAEALRAEQAEISEEPEQGQQTELVERDEDEIAELQELFSEEEEEIKDPALIPIDDEPTPFDDEEEEQTDEEEDYGFENEEDFEEESEQDETENKPKPTRKREEKGIKDRPRKQKPQLSLFDLMEPQEKSEQELLIERSLKYGSGFQHGKYRIFDKYNENPTAKAFADFLKREYGIGGRGGWGGDNEQHDGKGIRLSHCDENGKTLVEAFLKWPEAATRIADLIDDDNYLTEQEKAGYVEYRAEQNRQKELRAEEERQKREIIELAIVSEQPARKQRILDEYSKTTKIEDFAKFLRDEYGTAVETTSKYHARYDANGVFISKYNAIGNTELRVSLSWNNFAERVCDVIEAERLFAPEDAEYNAGFVDQMVKLGTENTESGKYAYHFSTFGKDEGYVRANCDEIKEAMLARVEVKDVQSDEWYIHATFYKDYCAKLQSTEEARQEHKERIAEIADKIIEEGTKNTTEGNYVHFFEEFGKHAGFAKDNAEEIAEELFKHEEVSDVELTPDSFDTNFYLDYCTNYVPKEEEDGYEEYIKSFEKENKPRDTKAPFNRFKELSENDRAFIERYSLRAHREPSMSPWDEVQQCETIAEGIYSVSTAGHGGIMIAEELAPYVLSPEALSEGMREGGYYCYEEDALQCIPLRELYDKGILNEDHSYFKAYHVKTEENGRIPFSSATAEEKKRFIAEWNDTVNESLATWNKEYWKKYQEAEQNQKDNKNTDLTDILDQTELGGAKTRFRNNVAAIRLVNRLYAENRNPTTEERKTLSRFVGWGGLSQAFDEKNPDWQKEYAELKGLLSAEDYDNARGSTLNAYYTPKEVIDGIYKALNRFGVQGNNRILEPSMGTGNFFGYMPKEVSDGARLYGVELDNLTGRIAAKLYPQANVQIKGFEDTTFPNDKFDIVVGNVPFGGYGVADSDYNRYNFKVHDYFLAKSVDKVKPGGIVAIVTSKGTMDKLNANARKYVAERAELLGAIRLPNTAFKQTAGTEAVADILFFRKREEKITDLSAETWLATGKTQEGYEINQYFIDHPEMVLGTLVEEQGLYGGIDTTVKADGRELKDALAEAVQNLPQSFYQNPETSPAEEQTTEVDYNVKPLCYKAENGRLYMRIGDEMVEQAIPKSPKDAYQRIQGMIGLREELHHILDIQIAGCSDEVLKKEQTKLNAQYDLFVRRYGNLNSQTNTKLFKDDGDSALLFSCEDVDEETKAVTKSDVFSKRTIRPYVVPTSTDDPFEALQISKNERGKVDIAYIEELTGKDYDTVVSELGNAVFRDPEMADENDKYSGFLSAEEYLSGQVVAKLDLARSVAAEHPEYRKNVDALEAVQPQKLTASEISVRLGATWIDKEYYKKFYCELLGVYWYLESDIELFYNPHDSSWRLDQSQSVRSSTYMRQKEVYGTGRAPAYRLFIDAMNLRATTIYDTIEEDGKEKRVVNHAETIAAREKQNKIKEEFINWIFKTPERREELEATYNRLFNRTRLPSYDGSYLKFPEMNPAIELKPHQKNAVHRIITGNSSTLLHHVVGAGKTFTVVASIMKMRQLGLCKKAMVTCPNHLVQQWAGEWRRLYPNAKILVASKEDLEKDNRKKFVSKVALGDWDGIIIAQSSFAKIPVSTERQIRKLNEEIAAVEATIEKQWEENGMPRGAVKNLEKIKKGKQAQLKKLMDTSGKDDVLKFEDLGVDYLFVDEAHAYKNLFLFTKMNNVAGISNAASQRASDLKLKCEYLQELHGSDRGVVFATGTPISNSMTEMYTMQTYLQPSTLKDLGITFFDGWAADFGETVTSMELSPSGQGYRARTRFAKFTNLPELLKLYRAFADVQTADMVKLNVPEAKRQVINLKPSDTTIELAEEIADRADKIYGGGVDSHIDNMLKVTSDGKKLALDPRCFVPTCKDEEGSKLNACAQNIYEIWSDTADIRGTQIVFCDLSTPKVRFEDYRYGTDFDAYNDLKYKLVQKGIPSDEIAFIHDADTEEQKQKLFDNVNSGRVRVLIGSTEKCGAGTNVQKRLVALHHLDTPYRPSDMEQREGRIIRQGNTNDKVQIFTYVTERTFDSYSYQILENKQRFISQINKGDLTVREAEDIDETTLSYAEIKAITAANPKIKRKMEVDAEVARLRVLEGQYRKNLYALQDKIRKDYPEEIRKQELLIERVTKDLEMTKAIRPADPEAFEISVNGKVYTDKKEGGKALMDALYSGKVDTPVAEYYGFKISMNPMTFMATEREITLAAEGQYILSIGESASGNLTRLENFVSDLPERKVRLEKKLEQLKSDLEIAKEQVEKPFEQAEQLSALLSEQAELNAELNLDKREEVIVDDDGEGEEENYMAIPILPEERLKKEVGIIDEEDKVAAMKVELLPDYTVTNEDMYYYGYQWDGMLPVTGITAKALNKMGVPVMELTHTDHELKVSNPEVFDEQNKLFGVEKPEWIKFIETEEGKAYIAARKEVLQAIGAQLESEEMQVFGKPNIAFLQNRNQKELTATDEWLKDKDKPSLRQMEKYAVIAFDAEYEGLAWALPFEDFGWNKADIQQAIYGNIENEELSTALRNHSYKVRLNDFLDKELAEVKYLNGRVTGFTADEIADISNDLKPSFEGSEFVELMPGESYDDWYDYFAPNELMPLLEQRMTKNEAAEKLFGEEAVPQYSLLPDYTVSDEDMHDYGYMRDEMIPLHKRAAQRLWGFGLEITILSHDNTEKAVERFSELTPTERTLYGIRKEVWRNYLNNEKTSPYLWARKEFCTAASDVMQKELDYVDEGFTINFIETNFAERVALEQYLADKERPDPKVLTAFVPQLLDEFSSRMWSGAFREYGWEESDLTRAIAEHLTNPVMQKIAMEVLSDEQKEEEQEEMPLYEDNPLDLPALDDELTVLAMQPDIKLDESRTLPGVKLLKNEELERWYVINRAGIEGERELNVGDMTNLEELEISPMEFDPNVFRTFYDEQEAQTYFNEKVSVMNSVKDNFGRKEIDYEAEVIKSVNTEFEVYKADVLSRSPEDIFYENYKIHVFTELKDVIDTGTENGYLEKEHYRALYEDRGSILTELYDDFIGDEYASLNTGTDTAEFIKDYCEHYHADAMTEKEQGTIYLNTAQYSVEHDEIEQYRISHRQSEECREAIDKAISENFDGMRLKDGFIPELIDKFGMERVQYILATTIRENLGDGRYSLENKGWAENIAVSESQDERRNCCLRSHPAVIDGVVNSFKKYMRYNDFLDEVTNDKQNDNKEEKEELAESKFLKQTSRGDKVVSITQDKNGRDIAVVQRKNDYTVAIGYDTTDGTWAQGVYDFKDEKAANEYREKYYGKDVEPQEKWYAVYVSRDALIKTYEKSSLMRMPSSNMEYADYTYFMYNNRIKNSRQLVDMQSDSRELCYKLMLAEGEVVNLRNRDGDEVELTADEFAAIVNHTSDKDYVREQKAKTIITLPREAVLGNYEKATLFKAPSGTEFAGYSYYLPNSLLSEDTNNEDGRIRVALSEDFKIKLSKGRDEKEITAGEYAALVNGTTAESYKRERTAEEKNREEKADEKKWTEIPVSESAVIATYEKSTLFKMPKGKYEGLVYYIPSGMVRKDEKGIRLRLPEDFEVHLKDKSADENIDIKPDELEKELKDKDDDAYENLYRRPSEEVKQKFDKVEQQLRTCLPAEMKDKPNWVIVRTRENADTGRLDKFLISPVTGKFAESDNPETWADFDTACKYARENGGVALAYALDGKDGIACIDLDHCVGEDGKRSALADEVLSKCSKTYIESSVSGKGIHVFGKTEGMDLRSFSKDGDMEFYQDSHFIAMTGDGAGYYNLESFDTPEMKSLLERKLERRTEWKNVGKGMPGLTQLDDRELLEKAFSAKNGDTVKRLYNGEDLRHNHSNSDMSLMNYLAFYSGGNVEQMTRIFATSGLYRPDKPQSYYEYTAIKAAKDTPHYTPPKAPTSAPKSSGSGNSKA